MKKIFAVIAVALTALNMNAQDIYVGGGLKFNSTSDESLFAVEPEVGYKLNDKFSIGGVLGFGSQGSGDSRYSEFSITPYVRHNLLTIGGNVGLFLDYQLSYKSAGVKGSKTNTTQIGAAPGLAYNLNSKLSVVTHLGFVGYRSSKLDVDGAEADNQFMLEALTKNISLSVYYNF